MGNYGAGQYGAGAFGKGQMSVSAFKGTFNCPSSTGSQSVSGVGFQPSAIIFWTSGATTGGFTAGIDICVGFAGGSAASAVGGRDTDNSVTTSSNSRIGSSAIYTAGLTAGFTSMDSDGFTLNWTAVTSGTIIHFLALGGASITHAKAGVLNVSSGTGSKAFTGVGFQPDFIILNDPNLPQGALPQSAANMAGSMVFATSAASGGIAFSTQSGQNPSTVSSYEISTALPLFSWNTGVLAQATLTSFDSDGFTLNYTTNGIGNHQMAYLAIAGGSFAIGAETQNTSTGTKAKTGIGFQPAAVLFAGTNRASSSSNDTTQMKVSVGATDGTNQGCAWFSATDNVSPSDANVYTTSSHTLVHATNSSTVNAIADVSTLDSDGFTLDWTTADATAREVIYVAFGPAATTPPASSGGSTDANLIASQARRPHRGTGRTHRR